VGVILVDQQNVDVGDIGVHRHQILGDVGVGDPAGARVDFGLLGERHAEALDDAADPT